MMAEHLLQNPQTARGALIVLFDGVMVQNVVV